MLLFYFYELAHDLRVPHGHWQLIDLICFFCCCIEHSKMVTNTTKVNILKRPLSCTKWASIDSKFNFYHRVWRMQQSWRWVYLSRLFLINFKGFITAGSIEMCTQIGSTEASRGISLNSPTPPPFNISAIALYQGCKRTLNAEDVSGMYIVFWLLCRMLWVCHQGL